MLKRPRSPKNIRLEVAVVAALPLRPELQVALPLELGERLLDLVGAAVNDLHDLVCGQLRAMVLHKLRYPAHQILVR